MSIDKRYETTVNLTLQDQSLNVSSTAVTMRQVTAVTFLAGSPGPQGADGADGPAGPGVAGGGSTDQILYKTSDSDYATSWKTLAKSDVGLGNVDNTSDASKPISTATQTALDAKVAGAASSTDNAIARFDGTTGKIVQNSVVTVSDAGLVEAASNFRSNLASGNPTYQFAEAGTNRAQIYYDVTNNRLTLQNQESNGEDAVYIPDPLTITGQFTGARILGTLLDASNSGSTFPEVRFLESTTVRGKIFYDFDEDQIVIQNQESDADDAVRFNDSVLINGVEKKLTISQTVSSNTSQYRFWQDDSDLFVIDRVGDTTGDGDHWVLVDLRSPQMLTLEDSESTLSLTTRAGAPGGIARTLDIYNDEYSRDNGMGMRQLYKNTTPNPLRFEEHDKTTNNGAWTMTDVTLTNGSPNGSYVSVTGVTPSAEDWIWDNAGTYLPDDTKITSIDTGAKTFVMNRNATSTGTAASVRGKNIRETMRINQTRQLLVRKFIASAADTVAEFGGKVVIDGTLNGRNLATDATKLDGIASGATANDTDANLKNRANHTGTQTAATISDFSTAADARITAATGVSVQAYDADLTTWGGKTAPSGTVVGTSDTQTLTNKRVSPRTGTVASSATPTINTDNVDFYSITALTTDITSFTTNLSGTPTERQTLWIAITGTAARAIAWGASFEASTVPLPTTTVSTNRLDVGFVWNTVTSKWRCVAVA